MDPGSRCRAYARLMLPSFGDSGATRRVVPGHPEASAPCNKISAAAKAVWFGVPMPQGKALIHTDPETVEAIREWIAGGAEPPAAAQQPPVAALPDRRRQ